MRLQQQMKKIREILSSQLPDNLYLKIQFDKLDILITEKLKTLEENEDRA